VDLRALAGPGRVDGAGRRRRRASLAGPVHAELASPSGQALFAVPRPVPADFVGRCHSLVQPGAKAQHLDLEAELDMLLHDDLS
jgi:hypothetical protein